MSILEIILLALLIVYVISILFVLFILIKEAIGGEKYKKSFIVWLILFSPYWAVYAIKVILRDKSLRRKEENKIEDEQSNILSVEEERKLRK